jgi:hypothetical protein
MSHTSTYQTLVKNIDLFCSLAEQEGHKVKRSINNDIEVKQYGSNWVSGCAAEVHLNGWRFPLAIKPNGEIMYDHWGSSANTMEDFGLLLQTYNKTEIANYLPFDQIQNYTVSTLDNGDVQLVVNF